MKPKMARKPRPTDEVSSPPLSPTSGRLMHKKRRIESESVSPDRKMSTSSTCDKGPKQHSPKFSPPKEPIKEHKVPKPLSPLPPLLLDDQLPCSSHAPVTAVQAPPEFMAFNYNMECPAMRTLNKTEEPMPHIKSEVLRDLQHELEGMLAHTMDFMRRAAGDLQFLETGEYPIVNLKKREMPVYQMRVLASPMSPTTQVHHEISLRSLMVPSIAPDEDVDVWPAPHLGTRYQSWLMMERKERTIDKVALEQFREFMSNEMNELEMQYVDVSVPEFAHRLRYTSSLEMFSSFERRLHNHALQLQQLQISEKEGIRVIHNKCPSSSWWTNPLASLGAAEAFSKNYRAKYDSFVSERRVKMMKINLLPSLRYQSFEDKQASKREKALEKENVMLKKQLKEAKRSVEKATKEMKQASPTPIKKKADSVTGRSLLKGTSPFKPTTPSTVTASTSQEEEKTSKELSRAVTGGSRFVMVVEDENGDRRVVPLTHDGHCKGKEEKKEKVITLTGDQLENPLHINMSHTSPIEKGMTRVGRRSHSRSRAQSRTRVQFAVAAGRARSAPPPPREKCSVDMMIKGAKEIKKRFGLRRCDSVRELTLKEAQKGIIVTRDEGEWRIEKQSSRVKKTISPCTEKKQQSLTPSHASPVKKNKKKDATTPNKPLVSELSQMQRLQQRHHKVEVSAAVNKSNIWNVLFPLDGTSKATPTLPIPSPTTTTPISTTAVATRTSTRRLKTPDVQKDSPVTVTPSPLQTNGVENGVEQWSQPQRRSTRDRKPSMRVQQSQLPFSDHSMPLSGSRKNSRVPDPTPEPEPFLIPVEPGMIPVMMPNGLSPMKEDMPNLSPMIIKPATRRQTRNSMDAAAPPPVLQVQQVLLQEQANLQLQQSPSSVSPKTTPQTRSRRGTLSASKELGIALNTVSPKDTVVTPVVSPKTKKMVNGLTSPVTRRRASLEEKERKESEEIEFLKEVKMVMPETRNNTPSKAKNHKKIISPITAPAKKQLAAVCICLKKLEEFKKSGQNVSLKQLDKWIMRKKMVVKVRFAPRSVLPKRERRVEIMEKCLQSIVTPSPTRYMLSEEEKKKMELEMDKETSCDKQKQRHVRLRRSDIERELSTKRFVSALWYNLKKAECTITRNMRKAEEKSVCVMVQRIEENGAVKVMAMKRRDCQRKRGVKRVKGWKKIQKKDGKKTLKVPMKRKENEDKKAERKVEKDGKIAMESSQVKGKKEKKTEKTSAIVFNGRMPKLIEGKEQWKEFILDDGKRVGHLQRVEEVKEDNKKHSKSPVKNGQRLSKTCAKKKKVEEEAKDVVIKIKDQKKEKGRKMSNGKISNGQSMKTGEDNVENTTTELPKQSKAVEKDVKKRRKAVKLTVEQIRNRYLIAPENRLAANEREKRLKGRENLVRIIRKMLRNPNVAVRNGQMKVLRALARHQRRNDNEGSHPIPAIDLSVPSFNERRPGAGWPAEWTIPKALRAPGVYRRRKLKAVRRAERRREIHKMKKEMRSSKGETGLHPMPWTKGKKEEKEGKISVLKSITQACVMKENGQTAKAMCEIKAMAREQLMDVIFDTVFGGGKIRPKDETDVMVEVVEKEKIEVEKSETKKEEKKEERPRRGSIRGKVDLIKDEMMSDEVKEEEDDEMDETLEVEEEEMGVVADEGVILKTKKKKKKHLVKKVETQLCKNEVAVELAVAQREYQMELSSYARMLRDVYYMMGACEHQTRARKNLEEKEDALAHLHAKYYREVPRRLPNEQEMEQIAKALSERREAMEEAFGANLWKQPRIHPDHPAWLTAEYHPRAKRQDKYNYFIDWNYDQKRETMRAHEKMWAAATSHHLPHGEAYGKYDVGVEREMKGEEKTLFEWEKDLLGALVVNRRKDQQKLVDPHKSHFRSVPKRPPTAASLKKKAEMEKKRKEEKEREEREEREEEGERRKDHRDVYEFESDDDGPKTKGVEERDEWDEKEEAALQRDVDERTEKKPTPPSMAIPSTEKRKALQQRWQRWTTVGQTGERRNIIKIEPDDFAEDEEDEDDDDSSQTSTGMDHASSVESSALTGTLSIKIEDYDGTEVKVKKMKKKKVVRYDEDGDKRVDRRKVGGLDLPSSISHLDPMIFLKLIPDNRSHKKGQGKKAMLKQIMLEYAQKEARGGNRSPAIPKKPQCTQQQLMSPGGTSVVSETPARPPRRSLVSPQGSEMSENRRESSNSIRKAKDEKKSKKRKEPVEEEEEVMPSRQKKVTAESRSLMTSPSSPPKAYGGRRSCTRKVTKLTEEDEEDDFDMKVPYTPASRRGGETAVVHTATRSPSVQSTSHRAPLSPTPTRSARRKDPVKYEEEDELSPISSRKTSRKVKLEFTYDD